MWDRHTDFGSSISRYLWYFDIIEKNIRLSRFQILSKNICHQSLSQPLVGHTGKPKPENTPAHRSAVQVSADSGPKALGPCICTFTLYKCWDKRGGHFKLSGAPIEVEEAAELVSCSMTLLDNVTQMYESKGELIVMLEAATSCSTSLTDPPTTQNRGEGCHIPWEERGRAA